MSNKIEIDKKIKKQVIDEIVGYFETERGEEIGNISAEMLLDFVTSKIGNIYYNRGIADAIAYMTTSVEDMHGLEKY